MLDAIGIETMTIEELIEELEGLAAKHGGSTKVLLGSLMVDTQLNDEATYMMSLTGVNHCTVGNISEDEITCVISEVYPTIVNEFRFTKTLDPYIITSEDKSNDDT